MPAIRPMLAESIDINSLDAYINDDKYWIEQKLDGERVVFHVRDSEPIPVNRNGKLYTRPVPPSVTAAFKESCWKGQWVIDGELLNGNYYVFDLPFVKPGDEVIVNGETPFTERRLLLEKLFGVWSSPNVKLVQTATTTEEKEELVRTVKDADGEGVMVKEKNNRYLQGRRSSHMLKAKFTSTLEAFIIEIGRGGKRSVAVGLYDENGNVVDVGSVTMSDRNLARVEMYDVIEIRYLYCGNGNRLYQPAFLRKRSDKPMRECTTDQLKMVNKEVQYLRTRNDG